MSLVDLPEPIWNAVHAKSKSMGDSEGAVSVKEGRVDIVFAGVHIKCCNGEVSAMRLSEFSPETLQQIADRGTWAPFYVKGAVRRSTTKPRPRTRGRCVKAARGQHVCDATCDYSYCERCNSTGRITVDKGDSEDCPDCA